MFGPITDRLIARAERRLGVPLDYVRRIAATDFRLLTRYNRIFGFLDPVRHLPPEAYNLARIRAARAADCGTCIEAEVNLARAAGIPAEVIASYLSDTGPAPGSPLADVAALTDAVVRDRIDAPEARDRLRAAYGEAGLIELAYAMNGAAMLPGIKRAMGFATACDATLMQRLTQKDAA